MARHKGGQTVSTLREVNLEAGMPYVSEALKRLPLELKQTRRMHCTVLKIIHGYGSTGTGGKIRTACRKYLTQMKARGEIQDLIPGEAFSIFEEATRRAFLRCDDLRRDRDLDRSNNGVTFIVL